MTVYSAAGGSSALMNFIGIYEETLPIPDGVLGDNVNSFVAGQNLEGLAIILFLHTTWTAKKSESLS